MKQISVTGVVLAGGRSSRMNGQNKCFAELEGKPLIRHVIDNASRQVDRLLINIAYDSRDHDAFCRLNLPLTPDRLSGHRGPLVGLWSAMSHMVQYYPETNWLSIFPCDVPFFPVNLVQALYRKVTGEKRAVAVVRYEAELQPAFSIWHKHLLNHLTDAAEKKRIGGFKSFLDTVPHAILDWPRSNRPIFVNINTTNDLALVRAGLKKPIRSR